jgi:hypothetical protein
MKVGSIMNGNFSPLVLIEKWLQKIEYSLIGTTEKTFQTSSDMVKFIFRINLRTLVQMLNSRMKRKFGLEIMNVEEVLIGIGNL